jgi:hypothetical protein
MTSITRLWSTCLVQGCLKMGPDTQIHGIIISYTTWLRCGYRLFGLLIASFKLVSIFGLNFPVKSRLLDQIGKIFYVKPRLIL